MHASQDQLWPEAQCPLAHEDWQHVRRTLCLTDRELEIVQNVFEGRQESNIATGLGISVHTVHTHLGRIYRKLGVRGLPGMLLKVFAAHLASPHASRSSTAPKSHAAIRETDYRAVARIISAG